MNLRKTLQLAALGLLLAAGAALAQDATSVISLGTSTWVSLGTADILIHPQGNIALRVDATVSGAPTGGGGIPLNGASKPFAISPASGDTVYARAVGVATTIVVVPQN